MADHVVNWKAIADFSRAQKEADRTADSFKKLQRAEDEANARSVKTSKQVDDADTKREKGLKGLIGRMAEFSKETTKAESIDKHATTTTVKGTDAEQRRIAVLQSLTDGLRKRGQATKEAESADRAAISTEQSHGTALQALERNLKAVQAASAGHSKQTKESSQTLKAAVATVKEATAATKSLTDAEYAQAKASNNAEKAALNLSQAETKLTAAKSKSASDSDAVRRAEVNLAGARITSSRASTDLERSNTRLSESHSRVERSTRDVVTANRDLDRSHTHAHRSMLSLSGAGEGLSNVLRKLGSSAGGSAGGFHALHTAISLMKIPVIIGAISQLIAILGALGAGAVAVVGALGPLTGLLGTIPTLGFAAAAALGTVLAAFMGVGNALKTQAAAQKTATKDALAAAKAQAAAARHVIDSVRAVKDAQQAQVDAAVQGARSVAQAQRALSDAQRAQGDTRVQGLASVQSAERNLVQAQQASRDAQLALTQARRDAVQNLKDLKQAVQDEALTEERASLTVAQAKERLAAVLRNPAASELTRRDAELSVREAEAALARTREQARVTREELKKANALGIEKSAGVVAAKRTEQAALLGVSDAQKSLAVTVAQSARANQDAARNTADAQVSLADAVKASARAQTDAARKVADAQRNLADALAAQKDALNNSSSAATKAKEALLALSPAGQKFVKTLLALKSNLKVLQTAAQTGLFPGLGAALVRLSTLTPMVADAFLRLGQSMGRSAQGIAKVMTTSLFKGQFKELTGTTVKLLDMMGRAMANVIQTLMNIAVAAQPLTLWLGRMAEGWTKTWLAMTSGEGNRKKMEAFFVKTRLVLELLGSILKHFTLGFVSLASAGSAAGMSLLKTFDNMLKNWAAWNKSVAGQATLKKYFEDAMPVVLEVGRLIRDVTKAFLGIGTDSSTANLVKQLRTELLPAFLRLQTAVSAGLLPAVVHLASEFLKLFSTLANNPGTKAFVDSLGFLVQKANELLVAIPPLRSALGGLLLGMLALKAVNFVVKAFTPLIALFYADGQATALGNAILWLAGKVKLLRFSAITALGPWALLIAAVIAFVVIFRRQIFPVLRDFAGFVRDKVIAGVNLLVDAFKKEVIPQFQNLVRTFKRDVLPILGSLGGTFRDKVLPPLLKVFEQVAKIQLWIALGAVIGTLKLAIDTLAFGLAAVNLAFKLGSGFIKAFTDSFLALIQTALQVGAKVASFIPGANGDDLKKAAENISKFRDQLNQTLSGVKPVELSVTVAPSASAKSQAAGVRESVQKRLDRIGGLEGTAIKKTAENLKQVADQAGKAAGALDQYIAKLFKMPGMTLGLRASARAVKAAIDAATASVKTNGRSLDLNTEAGRNNQAALDDIAAATNQYSQELLNAGASQGTLDKNTRDSRAAFIRTAMAMGKTRKEAEGLANQLIAIPNKKTLTIEQNAAKAALTVDQYNKVVAQIAKGKKLTIEQNAAAAGVSVESYNTVVAQVAAQKKTKLIADAKHAGVSVGLYAKLLAAGVPEKKLTNLAADAKAAGVTVDKYGQKLINEVPPTKRTQFGADTGTASASVDTFKGLLETVTPKRSVEITAPGAVQATGEVKGLNTEVKQGGGGVLAWVASTWNGPKGIQATFVAPVVRLVRDIGSWFGRLFGFVKGQISSFLGWVSSIWGGGGIYSHMIGPVIRMFTDVTAWFGRLVASLRKWVADFLIWLTGRWNTIWGIMTSPFQRVWSWVANNLGPGLKRSFQNIWDGISIAMGKFASFIGTKWGEIKNKFAEPVRWVINTVINKGLIDGFNSLVDGLKLPGSFKIGAHVPVGFAKGGVYPGYTPGRDVGMVGVSGGEAIMRPEWTRAVGKGRVDEMNAVARRGGVGGVKRHLRKDALGYADGGVAGELPDRIRAVRALGRSRINAINAQKVKRDQMWALLGAGPERGRNGLTPIEIALGGDLGFAKGGVLSAAQIKKGQDFAMSQRGKPYVWGGVGPRGYDCSGFQSVVANVVLGDSHPYHRLGSTHTSPWAGWDPGSGQYAVGWTNNGVGHMAGTIGGMNIESSGGVGVRAADGARGANNPMFQHIMHLGTAGAGAAFSGAGTGGSWLSGLAGWLQTAVANPAGFLKDKITGPLNAMKSALGDSKITQMVAEIPGKLISGLAGKIASGVGSFVSSLGSTLANVQTGILPSGITGGPALRALVMRHAQNYGWSSGANWDALDWLISHESGWNPNAQNPTSTAYGLFQFLNTTWSSVGFQKSSNPDVQTSAGLRYIKNRYGSPVAAKSFWQSHHWYDEGGIVPTSGMFDQGAESGDVQAMQRGGTVPGSGSGDKVPALLEPGEFVVRKQVAQKYKNQLRELNSHKLGKRKKHTNEQGIQHFHAGGPVLGLRKGANLGSPIRALRWLLGQPVDRQGRYSTWDNSLDSMLRHRGSAGLIGPPGFSVKDPHRFKLINYLKNAASPRTFGQAKSYMHMSDPYLARLWQSVNSQVQKSVPRKKWGAFNDGYLSYFKDITTWLGSLNKMIGLGGQGSNWNGTSRAAMHHVLEHSFGQSHNPLETKPWTGAPSAVEAAASAQQAANALQTRFNKALETLSTWGLTDLVENLLGQGAADGIAVAESAAKNKPVAIILNKEMANAKLLNSDDQGHILKLISLFATTAGSRSMGLRDAARAVGLSDLDTVLLIEKGLKANRFNAVSSRMTQVRADIASYRGGTFYGATGGQVPGHGTGDKVPAMLEPGEFVIRRKAAEYLGLDQLNDLNNPNVQKLKAGGLVQQFQLAGVTPVKIPQMSNDATSGSDGSHGTGDTYNFNYDVDINNPVAEKSTVSLTKALQKQAAMKTSTAGKGD